jgi:predicted DNA-binding transcriptional regulator AlpA
MMLAIKRMLENIIENIDSGNSSLTEEEAIEAVQSLKLLTEKDRLISKYTACEILEIGRATFDNYVRDGIIPKGMHEAGFKELRWYKKDIEDRIPVVKSLKRIKKDIP